MPEDDKPGMTIGRAAFGPAAIVPLKDGQVLGVDTSGEVVVLKGSLGAITKPTLTFRWLERATGAPVAVRMEKVLQQAWVEIGGSKIFWKDVPTVQAE